MRIDHPPSLREAWLDLQADGRLGWYDTVNYSSGHYVRQRDGIAVRGGMVSTLVGVGWVDDRQAATLDAFGALRNCTNAGADETLVVLAVRDSVLEVHAGTHTLRFRRAGTIGPQS